MKYRKKPVVIEAAQLTWETWSEVSDLLGDAIPGQAHGVYVDPTTGLPYPPNVSGGDSTEVGLVIVTLEGETLAREGDYIIRGTEGEIYPCKPDIFEATYEEVSE